MKKSIMIAVVSLSLCLPASVNAWDTTGQNLLNPRRPSYEAQQLRQQYRETKRLQRELRDMRYEREQEQWNQRWNRPTSLYDQKPNDGIQY